MIQPKAYAHNPKHVFEPLNLGYLAGYLRRFGYPKIQIHIGAFEEDDAIVAGAAQADVIGITATSPMMPHGLGLARRIKEVNQRGLVIFGGSHPSAVPTSVLENDYVDAVVKGEGEETLLEIVRSVENKTSFDGIAGVYFRQGENIIQGQERELIRDLDNIPLARDLLGQEYFTNRYAQHSGKREAWILSSRGCPFQCIYCASRSIWKSRWRARTPQSLVEEILNLVDNYGIQHVNFADDTFTVSKDRCRQFCECLLHSKIDITWSCNVHVNTVDQYLLKKMKKAGCTEVWMGVESGSPLILRELKKGITPARIKDVFRWARKVGLRRHAYVMLGSHSESYQTIQETERLISEIDPDSAVMTVLTPYPGSELYEQAKAVEWVKDDQDWSVVDLHYTVTMPTEHLTRDQIASEHQRLIAKLARYRRRSPMNWRHLWSLIISKVKSSSPLEYPFLAIKLWKYLREHSLKFTRP